MILNRIFAALCFQLLVASAVLAQLPEIEQMFVPTLQCENCHSKPSEREKELGRPSHILKTEWIIWSTKDKHSSAYKVLSDPRSKRIGELLGKDVTSAKTGCIQCHSANSDETLWSPACFQNGENLFIDEGVSCQTCHGSAELWESEHINNEIWKNKTPEEKQKFGFISLENPALRAATCLSCHLGNAKLGRVITHEMYAAGHPPLSGFEMEAFADKMPRHWRYSEEKKDDQLSTEEQTFTFERTRAVLVGSVVALQTAVDLAAADVNNWPELARLECYSCHHELQTPSWRQEEYGDPGYGRPRLELGCLPLVRATALITEGPTSAEQFDALISQSQKLFQNNVFGDPLEIVSLRTAIEQWTETIEQQLVEMPLGSERVREILELLLDIAARGTHDYDTARQLTGAITVIADELSRSGSQSPGLEHLLQQLRTFNERGFGLVSTDDKRVEDKFHQQLSYRARFKPRVFSALLASLKEGLGN